MDQSPAATESPPPKKRGRKRKSELPVDDKKMDESPAAAKSPPAKKRGRKRKSELTLDDFEVEPMIASSETVSRRGRKRRQINYFDMLNPDEFDDGRYLAPIKKESPVKSVKKIGRPKKIKSSPETEPESALNDSSEKQEWEENNIENNTPEKSNENGGKALDLDAPSEVPSSGRTSPTSQSEPDPSLYTDVNKIKKYNKTGATTKMINNLFIAYQSEVKDEKNVSLGGEEDKKKCKGTAVKTETSDEEPPEVNSHDCVCAVCNASMSKTLWPHHKYRYHNNLAWKVGEEPLDLSDKHKVMTILKALYKKKKPLFCQKCGQKKRSVLGYLSHQSQCQKSMIELEAVKVECELCGRKILPVSMPSHIKLMHTDRPDWAEKKKAKEESEPGKRSAKKRAMRIIEQVAKHEDEHMTTNLEFGEEEYSMDILDAELELEGHIKCKFQYCEFQSANMEDVSIHFTECDKKPNNGFACKLCLYTRETIEEVASHLEEVHEVKVEDRTDVSFRPEKKQVNMLNYSVPSFIFRSGTRNLKMLFQNAFKWTYQFHEENCDSELFQTITCSRTEWPILPFEMVLQYLPKLDQSCDVAQYHVTSFDDSCLGQTFEFKKYDLFDSETHPDGKCTIFCGGPVTSFAWLPIPFRKTEEDQKIAVAVQNSPDADYLINDNYAEPSLIQVWSLGCLKNKNHPQYEPQLELGIAFDHGPIWHLEWCPSGCYDDVNLGRMGLLAVAGSSPLVYIYSVPLVNRHNNKNGLFYKPKPVIKLCLERPELTKNVLGGVKYHPTKISWTKAAGHDHIAVGYTNGFVALFNVNTESVMLKTKDTADVTCIFPKKSFQAHLHSITGLTLHHLCGGARYLLTSSLDREINIFDLTGSFSPIWHSKKYLISDAHWMTNWLAILVGSDEASTSSHITTSLKQVHDHMTDNRIMGLLGSTSTITSVASSDWLNAIVQGNTSGETLGLTVHQLLCPSEHNKLVKKKRMLFGYVQTIDKSKTPQERIHDHRTKKKLLLESNSSQRAKGLRLTNTLVQTEPKVFNNEPIFYHEAQEKYGLVFCDNVMKSYDNFTEHCMKQMSPLSKAFGIVQQNLYPLTQINKVSFNPNRQASLFYATGYQAGFLRISYMKFLEQDPQIK